MWFPIAPDGQAYPNLIPECHARHADPSIQHSYDTQSLANLSLHQIDAGRGAGKCSSSIHPEPPFEESRRSKASKDMHKPGFSRDQAMSELPVPHLRPLRGPPAPETLKPLPPALPSTILRPPPTPAFAGMLHLPIYPSTSPSSFQGQPSQGLTGDAMSIDHPESQDPGDRHSQLSLSPAHKNSLERALSLNLSTEFKNLLPTRLHKPIIRDGRQQAVPGHGISALQETGHFRGFDRTPESPGQSFCGFHFTSMSFQR